MMVIGAWVRKSRYGVGITFGCFLVSLFSSFLLWITAQYKWCRHGFLPPASGGGVSPCTGSAERSLLSFTDQLCISKKHFRPGGMAPSEWTRSVRAVRDTPVADYSTPGVNATRVALHIALRPLFRRFFSLCRSPNLNKHSGVVANCDHTSECVHWVHACIGITMQCDAAKISPRVPSTLSSRSVGR